MAGPRTVLALGLLYSLSVTGAESPLPITSPSPSGAVTQVGSTGPSGTVTPTDAVKLLKEFKAAQAAEFKAMDHLQRSELKELKFSQAARRKEWLKKEADSRHKFFLDHAKGPDRRTYVKDYIDRRTALFQILADEYKQRLQEQDVRRKSLKDEQLQKLKDFQEALTAGKRPSDKLWPRLGR